MTIDYQVFMKEILESRSGSLDSFVPSPGSAQSNPRQEPASTVRTGLWNHSFTCQ